MSKNNKYSLIAQGVSKETYDKIVKLSYKAVRKGVRKSVKDISNDPSQYNYRGIKPIWYNSSIKRMFQESFLLDNYLRTKTKHLKSHGVDYYVLEGKTIVCFKKMDYKSRISGFYSKRFKDLLSGNPIHYSKSMLDNLALMGVNKPLPIYFIGHVLNYSGYLIDVRLVHYNDNRVVFEESLSELNNTNLFSSNKSDEIIVTAKKSMYIRKAN